MGWAEHFVYIMDGSSTEENPGMLFRFKFG